MDNTLGILGKGDGKLLNQERREAEEKNSGNKEGNVGILKKNPTFHEYKIDDLVKSKNWDGKVKSSPPQADRWTFYEAIKIQPIVN
jgi:hypothetical protein